MDMRTLRLSGTRPARSVVLGLLVVGLLVTSVGWYRSATAGSDERFDSCRFEDGTLILTYSYGANNLVSPSVDMTDGEVVVSLEVDVSDDPAPAILLHGKARFQVFGGDPSVVRYPDGKELACATF